MSTVSKTSQEIIRLSGHEIVGLLRTGQFSAREVVEASIERIEEVNPKLNALVVPLFEQARREAAKLDAGFGRSEQPGPLHGVPFTVKESVEVAGTPSTLGLTERVTHRAASDAVQVTRLKQAGAVLLGKTNVSLLLRAYETDNPVYGRTNNPWSLDRAPGGSSGGEASIIAAGGSVLGLGSDFGGSIRLPAHACGIHGLRPTSGRLTMLGHARIQSSGLGGIASQPGPIARSVADLSTAMRVLAAPGQEILDPAVPPVALPDRADISKLRVAFYTDNGIISPAPALRRAVREAAAALEAYGAEVEEWQPPDLFEAWEIQLRLTCADGLASYRRALRRSKGTKVRLAAMPGVVRSAMALAAEMVGQRRLATSMRQKRQVSIEELAELLGRKRRYAVAFLEAMNTRCIDTIICPPDALPALRHGSSFYVSGLSISYPGLYSMLGMPAGVVAATRVRPNEESDRPKSRDLIESAAHHVEKGSAGLPVGVQVVARHWREDVVLKVMAAIEEHFRQKSDYPAWPSI
jgi:fatty acid amide hydrolase